MQKTIAEARCPCRRQKMVNIRTQKSNPDRLYAKCGNADNGGCGCEIFERGDDEHSLIFTAFKVARWRDDDWKKAVTGQSDDPEPEPAVTEEDLMKAKPSSSWWDKEF